MYNPGIQVSALSVSEEDIAGVDAEALLTHFPRGAQNNIVCAPLGEGGSPSVYLSALIPPRGASTKIPQHPAQSHLRDFCYPIMPARASHPAADWSYIPASTSRSTESESTVEHCPACRAAQPDVATVRVRIAALVFFLRQVDLEVAEIADLLGVPRHVVAS